MEAVNLCIRPISAELISVMTNGASFIAEIPAGRYVKVVRIFNIEHFFSLKPAISPCCIYAKQPDDDKKYVYLSQIFTVISPLYPVSIFEPNIKFLVLNLFHIFSAILRRGQPVTNGNNPGLLSMAARFPETLIVGGGQHAHYSDSIQYKED